MTHSRDNSVADIRSFLTEEFLPSRDDLAEPDGRSLYLYECSDEEFGRLVKLLWSCGPPDGHGFNAYRMQWQEFRKQFREEQRSHRFGEWGEAAPTPRPAGLDWTMRGFVLYASEFWRRFKDESWKKRNFPDGLPIEKLTWLSFLSLVGWGVLYDGRVDGYVPFRDTDDGGDDLQLAYTRQRASPNADRVRESKVREYLREVVRGSGYTKDDLLRILVDDLALITRRQKIWQTLKSQRKASIAQWFARTHPDRFIAWWEAERSKSNSWGRYPGLYFPMLAAWAWWKVAPVRLPSSIRYLDTFAQQGGAMESLAIQCSRAFETTKKVIYRPTTPPNGYGLDFLPVDRDALPSDADQEELSVTLVFGSPFDSESTD